MYIADICKDIREKFNYGQQGLDHGLLCREQNLWLDNSKMLDYYDFKFGVTLEFRKRHRIIKVKTLDESVKAVLVDESQPVRNIVEAVCERIGISNPEEYSFSRDYDMKKAQEDAKLWLHPDKNLREQGITETDIVILKKKFFFTDQNVDRTDPVQLMLIYNQSVEMIISGKLPCPLEEAIQLASVQLQIKFGNYEPDKQKKIPLKDFVPAEYVKTKEIDKRIFKEYSKLQGLSELNAKFRYVQLVRSLKTYGISFFSVREPATKKKKAVDVLLGITKNSIVRLDAKTKDTIPEWNLTQLRRWAATPKTFTLDFGEYADSYYSVETQDGDEISRVISGYIDIIIKKRNRTTAMAENRVEESVVLENFVKPAKANTVVLNTGEAPQSLKPVATTSGLPVPNLALMESQNSTIQAINQAINMCNTAKSELSQAAAMPNIGNEPSAIKWADDTIGMNAETISTHVGLQLAAISALIIHATGNVDDMDYDTIGNKVLVISSSIGQITSSLRTIAGLKPEEEQERILQLGTICMMAIKTMLERLIPIIKGSTAMEEFYAAAEKVSEESSNLLSSLERLEVGEDQQNELIESARLVMDAVTTMSDYASSMEPFLDLFEDQNMIKSNNALAKEIASMLVAVTASIAPCVKLPVCREQLMEGAVLMRDSSDALLAFADISSNAQLNDLLREAIENVEDAISSLVEKARHIENTRDNIIEGFVSEVLKSSGELIDNVDIPSKVIGSAKALTVASTRLNEVLKLKVHDLATQQEREELQRDCRTLSDLTNQMVSMTKEVVKDPNGKSKEALVDIVNELRDTVQAVTYPFISASLMQKLIRSMKNCTNSANQLMFTGRSVAPHNRDQSSQIKLNRSSKKVVELIPKIVEAIKNSKTKPDDFVMRVKLIQRGNEFIEPCEELIRTAKACSPTIINSTAQEQLLANAQQLSDELAELESLLEIAGQVSTEEEMAGTIASLSAMSYDISQVAQEEECDIETLEKAIYSLKNGLVKTADEIEKSMDNDDLKEKSSLSFALVDQFQELSRNVMAVAAREENPQERERMMTALQNCSKYLQEALEDIQTGNLNTEALHRFKAQVKEVSSMLPSQRVFANANVGLQNVNTTSQLDQEHLLKAATGLMENANAASFSNQPQSFKAHVGNFQTSYKQFIESSALPVSDPRIEELSAKCSAFLVCLQESSSDSHAKNELLDAAKQVTSTVEDFLQQFSIAIPGYESLQSSVLKLQKASNQLEELSQQTTETSFSDNLLLMTTTETAILQTLESMKNTDKEMLNDLIVDLSDQVANYIENVGLAASLVVSVDPQSHLATKPAVDRQQLLESISELKAVCSTVTSTSDPKQILVAAGTIAKNTANVCTWCKAASGANIPLSEQQKISQFAKDIPSKTTPLVSAIKQYAVNKNEDSKNKFNDASDGLIQLMESLEKATCVPAFTSTEAEISDYAKSIQEPLLQEARETIDKTFQVLASTQHLFLEDEDANLEDWKDKIDSLQACVQKTFNKVSHAAPGQNECDKAIEQLNFSLANLKVVETADTQQLEDSLVALSNLTNVIRKASRGDVLNLISSIEALPNTFSRVAQGTRSEEMVDKTKELGHELTTFIDAIKADVADHNEMNTFTIDSENSTIQNTISTMIDLLQGPSQTAAYKEAHNKIQNLLSDLHSATAAEETSFSTVTTNIEKSSTKLLSLMSDVVTKQVGPEGFEYTAEKLSDRYLEVVSLANAFADSTGEDPELVNVVKEIGSGSIKFVDALNNFSKSNDAANKLKLNQAFREVSIKVSDLNNTVAKSSKGVKKCQELSSLLDDVIMDLESSIIFAEARQLDPLGNQTFTQYKDGIVSSAKNLTESIKDCIQAPTCTQEQIANLASRTYTELKAFKEECKSATIALSSSDHQSQVILLKSLKAVSENVQKTIQATCTENVNESIKASFDAIKAHMELVKSVGDENSRGQKAIAVTSTAIEKAIADLRSAEPALGTALPAEVVSTSKALAVAVANLIGTKGKKQDEIVGACGVLKKTIQDLSRASKAAIANAPPEKKKSTIAAVEKAMLVTQQFIELLKSGKDDTQQLGSVTKSISTAVNEIVNVVSQLVPEGYVDPNDPNVIAENELLIAAQAIELAAKKLSSLKPAERPRTLDESLEFDEQIIEATKSIATATSALVRSATAAQREIIAKGRTGPTSMYYSDGTWNEGLVSAAKYVVASTQDLFEAAQEAAKGNLEHEKFIVCSKEVAASTVQLLTAASVRNDPSSQTQIRLNAAAKAVTDATELLVQSIKSTQNNESEVLSDLPASPARAKVAEMEAQMSILRMEKELERARNNLANLRKGKYASGTGDKSSKPSRESTLLDSSNPRASVLRNEAKMERMIEKRKSRFI